MNTGFLLDYIRANSSTIVIDRAKSITPRLVSNSVGQYDFVYNGSEGKYDINIILDKEMVIETFCTCPYNYGGMCKHEVASILFLIKEKDNKKLFPDNLKTGKIKELPQNNGKFPLKDDVLNVESIQAGLRVSSIVYGNCVITDVSKDKISTTFYSWDTYHQIFEYERDKKLLSTVCSCNKAKKICEHRIYALKQIVQVFGNDFFTEYYLEDKMAEALVPYGLTLKDDYQSIFELELTTQGVQVKSKYKNIQTLNNKKKDLYPNEEMATLLQLPYKEGDSDTKMGLGFCIEMNKSKYMGMYPVIAKYNKAQTDFASSFTSLVNSYFANFLEKLDNDNELMFVMKILKISSFFQYKEKRNAHEVAKAITIMNGLWDELKKLFIYSYNPKDTFVRKNLTALFVEESPITMIFVVAETELFYTMKVKVKIGDNTYAINSTKLRIGDFFIIVEDKIYPIKDTDLSLRLNSYREASEYNYFKKDFETFYQSNLLPLSKKYELQLQFVKKSKKKTEQNSLLEKQVYIKDLEGQYITFQPMVLYGDKPIPILSKEQLILFSKEGLVAYAERDQSYEDEFLEEFKALHPDFEQQSQLFYLSPEQLLENYWFLHAVERMKQLGIKIFGANELKSFKFNVHKPIINVRLSSETDWFDIMIDISFGKQKVELKELRKAFVKKSNYVQLSDGTLGVLPEEWMKKFAGYFQTGQLSKNGIQISNYQFGIIDELYEMLEQKPVFLTHLFEKKKRLQNIRQVADISVPKGIKAKLRDYQQHGLNWLAFLDEHQLGGCLADDMGLGKTLQTIAFLQHLKTTQKNKAPSLIITPTSLIFNWNKELEKFCPTMKVLTFTGGDRNSQKENFDKFDIILSTYGTLLNDIEFLKDYSFHYVILDESQAIKNPDSKRYKAVRLLQSYNRLVLTGTPIENNTFDLYAQLNFLNPGLLGTMSHFKTAFSDNIDKEKDVEVSYLLSKIISPFVLRRTKEDVAKELPEKTEAVIYCEMGKEQRKVYDFYKDKYRDYLLNKIDENGVAKSQMYILEGLTKLRQICNSTGILNEEEDYGSFSVKLETLVEHIKEKTGQHKILVFSQFVKMLQIIKSRLEEERIFYEYLDGQTQDRQARVDNFQQNIDVRVFLISLKAGGTGLNLTEADYVYIIDPWWNPAVENQAIDRCYRIGQDKKVMAYRMICKDTIEEKIVSLQSKKKAVASSIISVDEEKKSFDLDEVRDLFK
ncbi:MAG: DEAD/DEAH box helicase [Chitinophagales bacterium]|nr:DEAD/DEAH box helicase [Chitinophagales bacterium]